MTYFVSAFVFTHSLLQRLIIFCEIFCRILIKLILIVFQALESSAGQFSSEVETSSKGSESGLLSVKPGLLTRESGSENVETRLITMDSEADVGKAFSPETVTAQSLIAAAEGEFPAAATKDRHGSTKHETLPDPHTKSLQAAAAVEDTRLIPARPTAPFTAMRASDEFIEEGDKDLSLSTAPRQDLVSV